MAKMTLPTMKAHDKPQPLKDDAGQTQAQQIGPVLHAAAAVEATSPGPIVEIAEGEVVEGMTEAVVESAQVETNTKDLSTESHMPRWGTPSTAPRFAAGDIAKLEELSRTMLEVRGIATTALATAQQLSTSLPQHVSEVTRSLQAQVAQCQTWVDTFKAHYAVTIADEHKHNLELADEVAMLRSRLDVADKLLSDRGLATTATAAQKPALKLHARRNLVFPARLEGDAVIVCYNPRQGVDGNDVQEFTLSKDNVRNVWTGYLVEVPVGYVCDVFVGADAVCALVGKGDSEYIAKIWTRGVNKTVSSGQEVCRLSLRRVEPMRLEVVQ